VKLKQNSALQRSSRPWRRRPRTSRCHQGAAASVDSGQMWKWTAAMTHLRNSLINRPKWRTLVCIWKKCQSHLCRCCQSTVPKKVRRYTVLQYYIILPSHTTV